ncbi:hypothetical protein GGS20DRAFT_591686 [Poronia punctata]|nr:hypothetical protein GGS20DRAFT_591686 [Poronia punctata]
MSWLKRDSTIPKSCYSICNNVVLEGQRSGRNPGLCLPDSDFLAYVAACKVCIANYRDDPESGHTYPLGAEITQWLDYCGDPSFTLSVTGSTKTQATTNPIPSHESSRSLKFSIATTTLKVTSIANGVTTITTKTHTYTSFPALPDVAKVRVRTTRHGRPADWVFTRTHTHLPNQPIESETSHKPSSTPAASVTKSITPSQTTTPSPSGTQSGESNHQRSRAWIAGPVIGGIVGILILLSAVLLLLRRRKKKAQRNTGAELHGESALKAELEVKAHPQELEAKRDPQELEAPGLQRHPSELPTQDFER